MGSKTGYAGHVIAEPGHIAEPGQIRRPQLDIESEQLIVQAQDHFGTGRMFSHSHYVSMDAA